MANEFQISSVNGIKQYLSIIC